MAVRVWFKSLSLGHKSKLEVASSHPNNYYFMRVINLKEKLSAISLIISCCVYYSGSRRMRRHAAREEQLKFPPWHWDFTLLY